MKIKSNKILFTLFFLLSSLLNSMITCAHSGAKEGDPVALLQYMSDNMIAGLKANKATLKTKPQIVYHLAYQYVIPYADLPQMAKGVLPPHIWNNATQSERMQFQKEFTTTLIRTYASALTAYQDQTIRFYPIRGNYQTAKSVDVQSDIIGANTQPIRVSYRLIRVGSVWRLYDLSVEGVDMLESFRAQFADILANGTMADLLEKMSAHNSRS